MFSWRAISSNNISLWFLVIPNRSVRAVRNLLLACSIDAVADSRFLTAAPVGMTMCREEGIRGDRVRKADFYNSRRPSIAFSIVISSVYSMSLPTGIPIAMRVTFTPMRLICCER
jgi:hypothetical protein